MDLNCGTNPEVNGDANKNTKETEKLYDKRKTKDITGEIVEENKKLKA